MPEGERETTNPKRGSGARSSQDMELTRLASGIVGLDMILGGGFQEADHSKRLMRFFTALINELRALGVTTVFTSEQTNMFGPSIDLPIERIPEIVDDIILMRSVELKSQLFRLISIVKMRESKVDRAIREFRIGEHGIEVAETFASAEAVLTGIARPHPRRYVTSLYYPPAATLLWVI